MTDRVCARGRGIALWNAKNLFSNNEKGNYSYGIENERKRKKDSKNIRAILNTYFVHDMSESNMPYAEASKRKRQTHKKNAYGNHADQI